MGSLGKVVTLASMKPPKLAVGGQAYFVNTIAQLNDVLDYVLEFEPAMSQVREAWTLMDTIGNAMSQAAQYMNRQEYDSARRVLDAAGGI